MYGELLRMKEKNPPNKNSPPAVKITVKPVKSQAMSQGFTPLPFGFP